MMVGGEKHCSDLARKIKPKPTVCVRQVSDSIYRREGACKLETFTPSQVGSLFAG